MRMIMVLFISLSMVSAWWEVGHMMVAQVARNVLKRNQTDVLDWADDLVFALNDLTDGKSNSFVEAAVWADDIKETGTNFLDNWHYTDRPINNKGLLITIDPIQISYNSVDGLSRARSILTNKKFIALPHTWAKAQMIRETLHIVGDMHQPLHNSNFYNESYKTGDLGGNFIKIKKLTGEIQNLHAYWDSGAAQIQPSDDFLIRPLNQSSVNFMEQWADEMSESYPLSLFQGSDMLNPSIWNLEGFYLAQQYVYPGLENTNEISQEYHARAKEVCLKQITLGGYRLASYLTDIYTTIQKLKAETGFVENKINELKFGQ